MRRISLSHVIALLFYSCSPNNVKQDNSLKKYFDKQNVHGCFGLFDNGSGRFTIYNLMRYRDSSFAPASTFDIVNSLIGLQTGKIINDSMIIRWDGVKREKDDWNKDLTMGEAFKISALPYFQEVASRIGKDTMQAYLDTLGYGTKKIKTGIDSFWFDDSLRLTPDEELGLVKRLYFSQLPFYKYNQEIVKKNMLIENNSNYKLSYVNGGYSAGKERIGWIAGWIEENQHPYFFVLNTQSPDPGDNTGEVRIKILKEILKHLGFLEGKK